MKGDFNLKSKCDKKIILKAIILIKQLIVWNKDIWKVWRSVWYYLN